MLTKVIQQTVHTTKPPSNFSLKDDQLQQMLALRPPTAATRPPTPESKVTLWDTQRRRGITIFTNLRLLLHSQSCPHGHI